MTLKNSFWKSNFVHDQVTAGTINIFSQSWVLLCSIIVVMLISTLENTNSSRAVQVCTTSFDEFCSARKEHCKWKLFSKIQSSLLREMWFCKKCSTSLLFSPFHFFSKVLLTSLTLATCCRARNWKKLINLIFIIQYIEIFVTSIFSFWKSWTFANESHENRNK